MAMLEGDAGNGEASDGILWIRVLDDRLLEVGDASFHSVSVVSVSFLNLT